MTTVVLQIAVAVATLATGAVCIAVVRRLPRADRFRGGWILAGAAFLLLAVSGIPHTVWAAWAFLAGPGTAVYEVFLEWSPAANHGRNVLMLTAGVLLALEVYAGRRAREIVRSGWAVGALAGALVLGTALGTTEGGLPMSRHYLSQSLLQLVTLVLYLATLLGAAVRGTLDRLLWLVFGLYALHQALSVLWHAALVWWAVEGAWSPSARLMQLIYLIVWIAMLALSRRRLRLARREEPVPGLLDLPGAGRPVGRLLE